QGRARGGGHGEGRRETGAELGVAPPTSPLLGAGGLVLIPLSEILLALEQPPPLPVVGSQQEGAIAQRGVQPFEKGSVRLVKVVRTAPGRPALTPIGEDCELLFHAREGFFGLLEASLSLRGPQLELPKNRLRVGEIAFELQLMGEEELQVIEANPLAHRGQKREEGKPERLSIRMA